MKNIKIKKQLKWTNYCSPISNFYDVACALRNPKTNRTHDYAGKPHLRSLPTARSLRHARTGRVLMQPSALFRLINKVTTDSWQQNSPWDNSCIAGQEITRILCNPQSLRITQPPSNGYRWFLPQV